MSASSDDLITRILRRIPGFRGYAQQEDRRQSEQQTREFVNTQLQSAKVAMDRVSRSLADAGLIDQLSPLGQLRDAVEAARSKVGQPVLGSSGLIGAPQLDEDALEDLYDLEATLMDQAVSVAKFCESLEISSANAQDQLQQVEKAVAQLNSLVSNRQQALKRLTE